MTMQAKFAGTCKACGGRIAVGADIEWEKGSGAKHVRCGGGTARRQVRARASAPKAPRTAGVSKDDSTVVDTLTVQRLGERDASALIGRTYRAGQRAGKVAGQIVTVIGAEVWYVSDEANEDMGDMRGGGWGATRHVRLATEDEAAPVLAAEAAQTAKVERAERVKAIARDVMTRGRRSEDEANAIQLPAEGWTWDPRTGTAGGVLAVDGESVIAWDSGHYDDYRRSLGIVEDAALAAELRALMGSK